MKKFLVLATLAAALAVGKAMAESRARMVAGGLLDEIQHGGGGGV